MAKPYPVTIHMIVRNEDRFVYAALACAVPFVAHTIIYDTGSTDQTLVQIKKFQHTFPQYSIELQQKKISSPSEIGELRVSQVKQTDTPFFLLLDGDEIWPRNQLIKLLDLTTHTDFGLTTDLIAVVNQTRDCVGDIYHYLPESFGKYQLLGNTGHYNIRLMKTLDYTIQGSYPNEAYYLNGKPVTAQEKKTGIY